MFTGIIEELGTVRSIERTTDSARVTIEGPLVVSDAEHGASISVNGVCLTVVTHDASTFSADVMAQTLSASGLGALHEGSRVNLERAARVDARLGGHIVQGHVDGTARVLAVTPEPDWTRIRFELDPNLVRYVVDKGSITIDGVSLTVSAVSEIAEAPAWFEVSLIPTTLTLTTLGSLTGGESVNIEVDVLAKYVERMLNGRNS
ncbi:MAG: riboflavin synthase [Actinobacteria bacterium]|uniref:Riboflavin synthase n=1 Tax=freshwater metagenome TaxID=449393 RepID=A0A6J6ITZ8_9ZZZZ|nr:riboflavin synthase [Actinomycetota bacterium]